jgi:hypothetical protein
MVEAASSQLPPGLVNELAAQAICQTCHPAEAVTALLRAATEILSARFDPATAGAIIVDIVEQAVALTAPAGRA